MKARVVDDINVKVLEGENEGFFFYHPNSVRRDIPLEFSPYVGSPRRKDRPFTAKDVEGLSNVGVGLLATR